MDGNLHSGFGHSHPRCCIRDRFSVDFDGTNQRDLLGVSKLEIGMMLSRHQNKFLRRKLKNKWQKEKAARLQDEDAADAAFLAQYA